MSKPRLLGISGSLRKASANTAILKALAESTADRATLELFPLHDIPLYNQDIDVEPWRSQPWKSNWATRHPSGSRSTSTRLRSHHIIRTGSSSSGVGSPNAHASPHPGLRFIS